MLRDKDGLELKPGDRVKVEFEGVVSKWADGRYIEVSADGNHVFSNSVLPSAVTKVVPQFEFEWTERKSFCGNTVWRCRSGNCEVYRGFKDDVPVWIVEWMDGRRNTFHETLEAAKAAVEQSLRGGA